MKTLRPEDRAAWKIWLRDNQSAEKEVWLLFYKKHITVPSITYDEAVEEALCYGWIDSIIRRVDDDSYAQKFTPRRKGSKWSDSNLVRIQKLINEGRVSKAGMEVYVNRSADQPDVKRLKDRVGEVPPDLVAALDGNALASKYFQDLARSHKREYIVWIISAKRPETRKKRVKEAVTLLEKGARSLMK